MKLIRALLISIVCCAVCTYIVVPVTAAFEEDNDFAEFEDFDSDDDFVEDVGNVNTAGAKIPAEAKLSKEAPAAREKESIKPNVQDDEEDGIVEDEDEFFKDDEEFEGFDSGDSKEQSADKNPSEPKLTVAKIPLHFR